MRNLGQLGREDNALLGETYEYIYDDAGNILYVNVYEYELFGLEGKEKKESHSYGYTNGEWGDLLTTYDGVEITYDAIGNPIRYYNGMMMDLYWEGRRLTSADVASYRLEFEYNEDGIRTAKCVNGTTHAYAVSGERIINERWAGNILLYVYDASGSPIGMKYLSTGAAGEWASFWFEKNLQGDIVAVYSDDGTKLISYTYDAWGNFDIEYFNGGASSPAAFNPFRYRGYYYDTETGFYYLNSRYYDPQTCRFINADTANVITATPMGLTDKNLFAYCDNNPIERIDHGGRFWGTLFDVISLGASIVEVCINPGDPWAWAGLIGDAIDLLPFVSGVGEVTRVAKTIDKVADTVQIAKAVDFTEDVTDIVKTLDRSSGFTKSSASAGRTIHQGYKATNNFTEMGKEFREIKGIRLDYIDFNTRTIYELKPMNPRGVRSGIRQLQRYNKALGGGFNLRLELY